LSKHFVFFSKTNLQHQLQAPKQSVTQMLSEVPPPPISLQTCRLGCLRLAHRPELWHTNPFIKS